jgi:prepilin-type N-terminal cleavage/methylation domain-containing protein
MKFNRSKGFTLIELLVVVAVIGVLAAVILVSINSSRVRARNVRRVSDINQLLNAFNLGLSNGSSLPSSPSWVCLSTTCYGSVFSGVPASPTVDAYIAPYITKPADPYDGGARDYGGYLYSTGYSAGIGPYDGYNFTLGTYLRWMAEPPASSTACGKGHIYNVTTRYSQCFLKID